MLPVAFKNQLLASLKDGFAIKKGIFGQCLEIYPKANWDEMYSKLSSSLNPFNKKHMDFIRAYAAGLQVMEMDNAGRLLISRDLASFANITGDIVITAKMGCMEVWNKEEYDKVVKEAQKEMPETAAELLGDFKISI